MDLCQNRPQLLEGSFFLAMTELMRKIGRLCLKTVRGQGRLADRLPSSEIQKKHLF